jgi:perosamine synthetase
MKKPEARRPIDMFKVHVAEESIERAVRVLRSGYIGEGPAVKELETAFERWSGVPGNVAVNSGTSALHLALVVAGVSTGDEVVTTAQTMMATSHAVLMQGATPVFADVQYETGNLDPADVARRITDKTRAILAVHWAGYPCDMEELHAIAKPRGLAVIEDAAHAIGATYRGKLVGSISPITAFSFQAIKHLTSGDGGMLSFLDDEQRLEARRLRWFGIDRDRRKPSPLGEPEWDVTRLGFKYHMNDIAAAIALGNLGHMDATLARRRHIASRYRSALARVPGITLLEARDDRESAHWIYTLLAERRLDLLRRLGERGIRASVVHLRIDRNTLYGGERDDLPNLARFTEAHLSLPVHEGLSDEDVEYVISSIAEGW